MDGEISTCLNGWRNIHLSKKDRGISPCLKGQKLPHGCVFSPNPSVEPQPELAEPKAEPVPPQSVFCLLFMNSLLQGAGLEAGEIPASPFPRWFRVGRLKVPAEHGPGEHPHGWRNQILTCEPFREEEKSTSGTRRLELQPRKCGGVKKGTCEARRGKFHRGGWGQTVTEGTPGFPGLP